MVIMLRMGVACFFQSTLEMKSTISIFILFCLLLSCGKKENPRVLVFSSTKGYRHESIEAGRLADGHVVGGADGRAGDVGAGRRTEVAGLAGSHPGAGALSRPTTSGVPTWK